MFRTTSEDSSVRRWAVAFIALALPLAVAAACDNPLDVEQRDVLTPDGTNVDLLVAGADRDFTVAYSGGGLDDKILSVSGVMSDELFSSGTFTTRTATDQRNHFAMSQGNTGDGAYVDLHQARRAAVRAFDALGEAEMGGSEVASEMKLYEGYTYVALAENFCSNIPFSDPGEGGSIEEPGPPLGKQEVFNDAITRFDEALSIDGGNLAAAVGKGRALLNLNQPQEAAAAVSGVPTDYLFVLEHSDNSGDQENPLFNLQSNGRYSVSDVEGQNGLDYRSAMDPRIPWVEDPEGGFDQEIPLYLAQKYHPNRSAPVVLAGGVEARLIEAEAALRAGDPAGMISILNDLRADVTDLMSARVPHYSDVVPGPDDRFPTSLDPLTDPGSEEAQVDMLFRERAFWMYLTGHRLADMRRLVTQYNRDAEDVYPTGAYHKGGTYDTDVVMPLEFAETNNANYDASMCSFTTP